MKSYIIFLFLFFCCLGSSVSGQAYLRMIESGEYRLQQIQESAENHFKTTDRGKGTGYKQFKRWEYNALRMADENGYLKSDTFYLREWEKMNSKLNVGNNLILRNNDFWTEMGPDYYSSTTSWNPGVGRLTSFFIDPKNEKHIIAGAETGGVWKTTNGAISWRPLMDFFSNIAVECVVMDPINQNIYYFGSTGGRIYVSRDEGDTWTQLANAGSSKVRKILIHPQNTNIMYACTQNSGFFRSDDGGDSWTKITSDGQAYDAEFKPGNPNTVYLSGTAVHISEDGGLTFRTINQGQGNRELVRITGPDSLVRDISAVENSFNPGYVSVPVFPDFVTGKVVLYIDSLSGSSLGCENPKNGDLFSGNIVLIERGTCAFASKVVKAQQYGAAAVIVMNSIAGGGASNMGGGDGSISIPAVMISFEDGEKLKTELESQEITVVLQKAFYSENTMKSGPKMIGVSEDDPNVLYVLEANKNIFSALFKSVDSGENFTKLDHANKNYFGYDINANDDRGQAPRNMAIAVHPQNADEVHIGGILTFKSNDGGLSFSPTSDWIPDNAYDANIGYCHADICDMSFYGDKLYVSSDGGIFKAENTTTIDLDYYEDLTTGLGIRQFYKIGVSQTTPAVITGGSQDNGSSWYSESTGWQDWLGADGMEGFVDKNNPLVLYGTSQNGGLYRKNEFDEIKYIDRPTNESGNWVTPFEQDPLIPGTIYTGFDAVYKSNDEGDSWTQISQIFSAKLNHLKIANSDNNFMYAAHGSSLYKTVTGGGNWIRLSGFSGNINDIAIHPQNPQKVAIVTTSGTKVFITENGGTTWQSFRKNLPDFAALSVVWQGGEEDGLYVGMNYGIFYLDNPLEDWIPFFNNLPNVIINELEINHEEGNIYAATYGRGLWVSPLYSKPSITRDENEIVKLSVLPNPAGETAVIQTSVKDRGDISVFNSEGKLVIYRKQVLVDQYRLDVSGLNTGLYFLRINHKTGVYTTKLIKS